MYSTHTKTEQFDLSIKRDREAYSEIIDDPLSTIISVIKEKLTEKAMDEEGNPSYINEKIVLVVTWQEKRLVLD